MQRGTKNAKNAFKLRKTNTYNLGSLGMLTITPEETIETCHYPLYVRQIQK